MSMELHRRRLLSTLLAADDKDQLIHYRMVYDGTLGEAGETGANICADTTGGFTPVAQHHTSFSGPAKAADISYDADSMTVSLPRYQSSYQSKGSAITNNAITVTDFAGWGVRVESYTSTPNLTTFVPGICSSTSAAASYTALGNRNFTTGGDHLCSQELTEWADQYFRIHIMAHTSSTAASYLKFYGWWLYQADDWESLCDAAGLNYTAYKDEAALCANAAAMEAVLGSKDAVTFMVKNCTGSLLTAFIQSSTALAALEASPMQGIVRANRHWAKFLGFADSMP